MDWQALKETAWKWTQRFALFWLAQTSLVYLWACVVAAKPIGPVEFIRFQNHVIQYRPLRAAASVSGVALAAALTAKTGPASTGVAPGPKTSAYVRLTEKVEVMDSRETGAGVVVVSDAKTPVTLLANFSRGWSEINAPVHGYVKSKYLESVTE